MRFSQEFIRDVMEQSRPGLAARADAIAARAEALTNQEEVGGDVIRSGGTRPKGRPYERVTHTNSEQEHGSSKTERRRILGRSVNG